MGLGTGVGLAVGCGAALAGEAVCSEGPGAGLAEAAAEGAGVARAWLSLCCWRCSNQLLALAMLSSVNS